MFYTPEISHSPLKNDGWKMRFLLGLPFLVAMLNFWGVIIRHLLRVGPLEVTVTTKILRCLVRDSYKPLFAPVTRRGPAQVIYVFSF